ncbi:MAG TPA: arylsulfotransferase family protein [Gemmatimonadales bacterium]|nr:arylsulfotransferase family protein [Gemmatimonadales bacterium]
MTTSLEPPVFHPIMARRRPAAYLLLLGAALGCDSGSAPPIEPRIEAVSVGPNPRNALALDVAAHTLRADSIRFQFTVAGGAPDSTGFFPAPGNDTFPVLGLRPDTSYSVVAEAVGPAGVGRSTPVTVRTGSLPPGLVGVHLEVSGVPTPGYAVTAVMPGDGSGYLVAFDSAGRLAWYRGVPFDQGEQVLDVRRWPNGNYTMYVGGSSGWQPVQGSYLEITPRGVLRRQFRAPAPYYTDGHDIRLEFQDTTLTAVELFSYDLRPTDLTSIGGPADVLLAGHQLLRMAPGGTPDFFWNGWDYFKLTDWIEHAGLFAFNPIDFDHPNSLDVTSDGAYLVSWRHLSEVNKIHAQSGRVIWRLGGANNQFTFVDDPENGFSGQHYAREIAPGEILLYDNGISHATPETRMVQYRLDEAAHTATLVWEYRHTPAYLTGTRGSVDRLESGNTLIGWATMGRIEEVTPTKVSLWEGQVMAGTTPLSFYRALRTPSLYRFARP